MGIRPAHHGLDYFMQIGQCNVRSDNESPPYRRLYVLKRDFKLKDRFRFNSFNRGHEYSSLIAGTEHPPCVGSHVRVETLHASSLQCCAALTKPSTDFHPALPAFRRVFFIITTKKRPPLTRAVFRVFRGAGTFRPAGGASYNKNAGSAGVILFLTGLILNRIAGPVQWYRT